MGIEHTAAVAPWSEPCWRAAACTTGSGGSSQVSASKWAVSASNHAVGLGFLFCTSVSKNIRCLSGRCRKVVQRGWLAIQSQGLSVETGTAAEQGKNSQTIREVLLPFPAITVYCLSWCWLHLRAPLLLLVASILEAAVAGFVTMKSHIPCADTVPTPRLPPLLPYLPALATANVFFPSWCGCPTHKTTEVVYELRNASHSIIHDYIYSM